MKRIYGLTGYPLGHSFSRNYFNKKFESEGIDAEYVNFEIENVKDLKFILRENPALCGLNVTIPHKINVIPLLDSITDNAKAIGAVNVIKFKKNFLGKLYLEGHNSDILGFKQSLEPILTYRCNKALVLGTGGSSKAICLGLKQLNIEPLYISRTKKKNTVTYQEITPEIMKKHLVIVNTTPLGMYPKVNEYPDIPYDLVTPEHILYDLTYNPDETVFMRKGKAQGATVKNGLEMLILQANAAWDIWNK
jgi:shikimate dehydrogenase